MADLVSSPAHHPPHTCAQEQKGAYLSGSALTLGLCAYLYLPLLILDKSLL